MSNKNPVGFRWKRFGKTVAIILISSVFFIGLGMLIDYFVTEVTLPPVMELIVGFSIAVILQAALDAARDELGEETESDDAED